MSMSMVEEATSEATSAQSTASLPLSITVDDDSETDSGILNATLDSIAAETVKASLISPSISEDYNSIDGDSETDSGLLSASLDSIAKDSIKSSLFSPTSSVSTPTFTPNGSKSSRGKWTADEDEVLREAVLTHGGRNWKKISEFLHGRTDVQCLHRWQKVLRPGLVKGPWTKEEDDKVVELVGEYGVKSWSFIARKLEGRLGKQCRERWYNHLNPDINKDPWSAEEDRLITQVCTHLLLSAIIRSVLLWSSHIYTCTCYIQRTRNTQYTGTSGLK
mmetsp:Transcript_32209/g.59963  ORF Transcript_32209/g.59963 Transcript_32209/m.59963 type:complete len:276 (-) Transcript_32209:1050-1877(-)